MNTISVQKIKEDTARFLNLVGKEEQYAQLVIIVQNKDSDFTGTIEAVNNLEDSETKEELLKLISECEQAAIETKAEDVWLSDALQMIQVYRHLEAEKEMVNVG